MSRSHFGWSLPPGVSNRMIEDSLGAEGPCDVCRKPVDLCICPECCVCGGQGDLRCYDGGYPDGMLHGLKRSQQQIDSELAARREQEAEQARWAAYATRTEEYGPTDPHETSGPGSV